MNARQIAFISFAESALLTLERDREWNGDTIDEIGMAAINLGLAKSNDDALFEIIK